MGKRRGERYGEMLKTVEDEGARGAISKLQVEKQMLVFKIENCIYIIFEQYLRDGTCDLLSELLCRRLSVEGLDVAAAEFRWLAVRMLADLSGAKGGEDGQRSSFATDFVLMVACHRQQAWLPGKYLVCLCSCWMNWLPLLMLLFLWCCGSTCTCCCSICRYSVCSCFYLPTLKLPDISSQPTWHCS